MPKIKLDKNTEIELKGDEYLLARIILEIMKEEKFAKIINAKNLYPQERYKRMYKKFSLYLHPDKNKKAYAERLFKLLDNPRAYSPEFHKFMLLIDYEHPKASLNDEDSLEYEKMLHDALSRISFQTHPGDLSLALSNFFKVMERPQSPQDAIYVWNFMHNADNYKKIYSAANIAREFLYGYNFPEKKLLDERFFNDSLEVLLVHSFISLVAQKAARRSVPLITEVSRYEAKIEGMRDRINNTVLYLDEKDKLAIGEESYFSHVETKFLYLLSMLLPSTMQLEAFNVNSFNDILNKAPTDEIKDFFCKHLALPNGYFHLFYEMQTKLLPESKWCSFIKENKPRLAEIAKEAAENAAKEALTLPKPKPRL